MLLATRTCSAVARRQPHNLVVTLLCFERAMIIAAGRIVVDGTPAELAARSTRGSLDDVFRAVTADA